MFSIAIKKINNILVKHYISRDLPTQKKKENLLILKNLDFCFCVPGGPNCGKCWYQVMHTIYKMVLLTMKTWQFWTITALYYGTLVTKALKWSMILNKKRILDTNALLLRRQIIFSEAESSVKLKLKVHGSTNTKKRYQTNCWINRSTKFQKILIDYLTILGLKCLAVSCWTTNEEQNWLHYVLFNLVLHEGFVVVCVVVVASC